MPNHDHAGGVQRCATGMVVDVRAAGAVDFGFLDLDGTVRVPGYIGSSMNVRKNWEECHRGDGWYQSKHVGAAKVAC